MSMNSPRITRALLTVSDKHGLTELARGLVAAGIELVSTGGTRRHLVEAGIAVRDISDLTGFPEIMDGRVKTLHPKVHGGILCRHDQPEDHEAMKRLGIPSIELVVVNLYPFAATIAKPGVSDAEAIEQIDIGGPSLIRGAAKNHAFTTVVTSPAQYDDVLAEIASSGGTTWALRRRLAGEAFALTAEYDRMIAGYFAHGEASTVSMAGGQSAAAEGFPERLTLSLTRRTGLRYGENPHQRAALYGENGNVDATLVSARQLHGKELSYNNLLDLDSALAIVRALPVPAAAVIKHNNPCGAAMSLTQRDALARAMAGDPTSAFGSVLGLNREVDLATAEVLCEPGLFVEAIVAPGFSPEAFTALTTRPKWHANVRLLATGTLPPEAARWDYRRIAGGLLVQDADILPDPEKEWRVVTTVAPNDSQWNDLRFGWSLVRQVKSNAIVVARDTTLWGAGAGQMSRVDSVQIAIGKSGDRARGGAMASDAFFPFPDSIELAAAAGIKTVIQPGGSKKDEEVIAACDRHGLAMVFTGRRHFKH